MAGCFDAYKSDRDRCQIGLDLLDDWVTATWGYQPLGCLAKRDVRGRAGVRSLHAEGRALDGRMWSRGDLDELFALLILNADALNVQAFNDYERQARWRCASGWKLNADIGDGAGGPTFHIERNWQGALDDRPIIEILSPLPEEGTMQVTATTAIASLPATTTGRRRVVRAELQDNGDTHLVGYQCHLSYQGPNGIVDGNDGYGVSVLDLGRLNAPISELTDGPGEVIGVSDGDLGTFTIAVRSSLNA